MRREPPDILITTPESLYLMISSQAREILGGVEAVIVDEIHAVAPSKRGSHLALTLERLDRLSARRGRSAEDRPVRDPAAAGADRPVPGRATGARCEIVDASEPQAARPGDRGPGRGHGRAEPARPTSGATAATPAPTPRSQPEALTGADRPRPDRGLARPGDQHPLHLAGDLSRSCCGWCASTTRRSSSSTTAARPSGSPSGSTRCTTTSQGARPRPGDGGRLPPPSTRATPRMGRAARRDRPRPPRLPLPRGARPGRGDAQVRASCPAWSRPPRWSWGSTWAPSTW